MNCTRCRRSRRIALLVVAASIAALLALEGGMWAWAATHPEVEATQDDPVLRAPLRRLAEPDLRPADGPDAIGELIDAKLAEAGRG